MYIYIYIYPVMIIFYLQVLGIQQRTGGEPPGNESFSGYTQALLESINKLSAQFLKVKQFRHAHYFVTIRNCIVSSEHFRIPDKYKIVHMLFHTFFSYILSFVLLYFLSPLYAIESSCLTAMAMDPFI